MGRTRRIRACIAWAAVGVSASIASSASADDLIVNGERQEPGLNWIEWIQVGDDGYCAHGSGDGTGEYPEPLVVSAGAHRARIVYGKAARPERLAITAHRAVDGDGNAVGPRESIQRDLLPRRGARGRITGWKAVFRLDVPPTYYLDVYTQWPRNRVCGGHRASLLTYSVAAE
jgi:hypothetical protein